MIYEVNLLSNTNYKYGSIRVELYHINKRKIKFMSSLKKTAIIITIITLGSKLLGFGREIVLAYFYGTSYIVDVYLMASSIPGIVFGWLTTIAVSYTPIYTDIRSNLGEERSHRFTNNLISIVICCAIVCVLFGLIFSKQIVYITAPGFKGEAYNLTVRFLKVSLWTIIFNSIVQILTAYLNCNNKFIQSNISTLVISSTQLAVIFVSGLFGEHILIYGILFSSILHLIIVYIFSNKNGFRYKFEIKKTPEIEKAFIIVVPIFISSMIMQINTFVDKMFASQLVEGSIAALNYSAIIRAFIFYIFTMAITTMIYPMLSQSIAENNMNRVKDIFSKGINIIIILFVPITIGAIILSEPAISFVYERGEFSHASTIMTSTAFVMYTIGLLALALRDVITKVFYSLQDTKSTMYVGIVAVMLNIVLNMILIKPLGHNGLALATSLSELITLPLFFILLRKKIGNIGLKDSLVLFIKASIAGIFMGIVVYFSYKYFSTILGTGRIYMLLIIVITSCLGGLLYFILMVVMKVKEMEFFTDIIKDVVRKIKRK